MIEIMTFKESTELTFKVWGLGVGLLTSACLASWFFFIFIGFCHQVWGSK